VQISAFNQGKMIAAAKENYIQMNIPSSTKGQEKRQRLAKMLNFVQLI
jgi:hypothetical protein